MQAFIWVLSGLAAGVLARLMMKGQKLGRSGELILGLLGGIVGGWLLHRVGGKTPATAGAQFVVALVGAMALLGVTRLLIRAMLGARKLIPSAPIAVAGLEEQLARVGAVEKRVLARYLQRQTVSVDAHQLFEERMTLGQRVADRVATFGGSWTFLGLFALAMVVWMLVNSETQAPFDPFPFILLNLVLSCLAAVQAPIIMMSQNRHSERDRIEARHDYEVNLKAEMEIMNLHAKIDTALERDWVEIRDLQRRQVELLEEIRAKLGK